MKEFKKFRIMWNSLYPSWHIGKPIEDCDAKFEICLGCFQIYFWKEEE